MAEAIRRWGKAASIRYDRRHGTAESRAAAKVQADAHRLLKPPAPETVAARGTPERREADRVWRAWRDAQLDLDCRGRSFRYAVGSVVMGLFFMISGEGDSWEEAFGKCEARTLGREKSPVQGPRRWSA